MVARDVAIAGLPTIADQGLAILQQPRRGTPAPPHDGKPFFVFYKTDHQQSFAEYKNSLGAPRHRTKTSDPMVGGSKGKILKAPIGEEVSSSNAKIEKATQKQCKVSHIL